MYGILATSELFVAEHGLAGAMPPAVLTRWMLFAAAKTPVPVTDFAVKSSQGIAEGMGPGSFDLISPTTALESTDSHVGPA